MFHHGQGDGQGDLHEYSDESSRPIRHVLPAMSFVTPLSSLHEKTSAVSEVLQSRRTHIFSSTVLLFQKGRDGVAHGHKRLIVNVKCDIVHQASFDYRQY